MQSALLTDRFFQDLESSVRDVNSAETLPPVCYMSPEFYQFEKETIFYREWLCVGREAWVRQPGDYFTASHVGEPIVVVRTEEGSLRALSSVCRHRAALVAEGHGNTRSFRCPYHHWTYRLDGRLLGAPEMTRACDFDKNQIKLPELRLETWLGFIFINFDPDAAPLAPRLSALTNVLENYHIDAADEYAAPGELKKEDWNWKVRFENTNDGYHANRLHSGPYHDCVPSSLSRFPELPPDTAGYFRYNGTLHPDFSFNPTLKATMPIFPALTMEERNCYLFLCIPPSLTFNCGCDFIAFTIFHVEGPAEMHSRRGFLVAPGTMKDPLFSERVAGNINTYLPITMQDRHVDKLVQTGLASKYAIRGRYSWQEQSQRELNAWLVGRYQEGWERMK